MATYSIQTRNGNSISVPDFAVLNVDGLQIIGDQTTDWNEPYNRNFLVLDKKIKDVEDLIGTGGEVDLSGINAIISALQTELNTVKIELASNSTEDNQDDVSFDMLFSRVDALVAMVSTKVDKVVGKELSTNDYTDLEKTKLAGIANGAQLNTVTSVAGKMGVITLDVSDISGLSDALATAGSDVDLSVVNGDIIPALNSTYNIGSETKRWKGIYVDEAYLSANTLYIDGIPVIGTDSENIIVKADVDQSITVQTKGLGITNITSENEVSVSTAGTNADVVVQATGTNSKVKLAGANGIELSSNVSAQSDVAISGNLTLSGNLVMNGPVFEVNATTVSTKDNIIVINKGEVGSGVTAGKAGLQVDRGDFSDYQLVFDESIDKFVVGQVGGTFETIATREYVDSIDTTVDLSGYYTKTESDANMKLENIDNSPVKAYVRLVAGLGSNTVGLQTIDGVYTNVGDRILVKNSYDGGVSTGIFVVNSEGPWERAADCPYTTGLVGSIVSVQEGTVNKGKLFTSKNGTDWNEILIADATGILEVNISGNAGTATRLQSQRTINGVAFDGSSSIVLPVDNRVLDIMTSSLSDKVSYTSANTLDLGEI